MKVRTALAVFTLLAVFALIQAGMRGSRTSRAYATAEITVNSRTATVLLADTELKRIRGLSGRSEIGADGMLFLFPREDFHGLWMKEMLFPLDLIWLSERKSQTDADIPRTVADNKKKERELEVVDIEESVAPETFPEVFYPREKARYVLEADAGFAQENRVTVGSILLLKR